MPPRRSSRKRKLEQKDEEEIIVSGVETQDSRLERLRAEAEARGDIVEIEDSPGKAPITLAMLSHGGATEAVALVPRSIIDLPSQLPPEAFPSFKKYLPCTNEVVDVEFDVSGVSRAESPPSINERTHLSDDQRRAISIAMEGHGLFFTGAAGTGKSTCLMVMIESLRNGGKEVAVTAPTGSAAILVEGSTLHAWVGAGLAQDNLDKTLQTIRRQASAIKRWKETDVLVIDECSMVDPPFFDKINAIGQDLRRCPLPFGGLQLILCGDFAQVLLFFSCTV